LTLLPIASGGDRVGDGKQFRSDF